MLAFADESYKEASSGGFYVLAAAVFSEVVHGEIRDAMCGIKGRRRVGKLHWNEMDSAQREVAAKTLAEQPGFHVVAIGSPVPTRRQERARAWCLRRLVVELHGFGVDSLVLEARTSVLNARDVDTVKGARFALPRGTRFWVSHLPGRDEPLLWAADIVAGAMRADKEGRSACRQLLRDCVYEIEVETDC
ncbi:hypothetical protein [Amycolatopsis samaneae]|uniref:DUF3800 domain-containing protein n=1 Tax=Amycolatopsis samaneae TaxID=664691 RepID=A0ABW5GIX1_9PSEU